MTLQQYKRNTIILINQPEEEKRTHTRNHGYIYIYSIKKNYQIITHQ
jgi:hypothetical protein